VKTPTLKRRVLLPLLGGLSVLLGSFAIILGWAQGEQLDLIRGRDGIAVEHSFRHELGFASDDLPAGSIYLDLAGSRAGVVPSRGAVPPEAARRTGPADPGHHDDPLSRVSWAASELRHVLGLELIVILNKRTLDGNAWLAARRAAGLSTDWDRFADRVVHVSTLTREPREIEEYLARPAASAAGGQEFDLRLERRRHLGAAIPLRSPGGDVIGEVIYLRDHSGLIAAAHRSFRLAGLVALAIGLAATLLLVRTLRFYVLAPLLELRAVAERAGRGELSRTATIHRSDELGELARSMNHMIQELRDAQEERTRLIVDAALDAVVTIDDAGRIIDWNAQAERIFGWPRDEAIGRQVADTIIPAEYRHAHMRGMKRFLETGESGMLNRRVEVSALRRDGDPFPAEIAITPLRTGDRLNFSAFIRDITERKRAEEAVRKSEERFRRLVETASVIPWEADPQRYRFTYVGPQAVKLLGYTLQQWHEPEFWSSHLHPEDREFAHAFLVAAADRRSEDALEYRMIAEDGHIVWLRDIITFARNENGEATMLGFRFDITERKRLERQLLGSQRMEAVGRLAGGIAHDFNNLITAILGYASLVHASLPDTDPVRDDVDEITRAANRAASLTQQLLAFARKQVIQPKVVDLNELVDNLEKMLKRLIGEDIRLETTTADDLWKAKIDPGQFEQVLVNLAVNARDAMPEGGQLIIETSNARLQASTVQKADVVPGDYVAIAVTDTGTGMDEQTMQRIFEPFFTTKEVGKGTGLGLATCFGIVKQAGGYIFVYSEVGRGTTFNIFVPRAVEDGGLLGGAQEKGPGGETILLVEDDTAVRDFAAKALEAYGYRVLTARYGDEAIAIARDFLDPIDLMLTDVYMPHMGGGQAARAVRELRPAIKVLYMSAYPDNVTLEAELGSHIALLSKPFSPEELEQKVRELLDETAPAAAAGD
jgi:PAS domain S-box-containing protein